MLNVLVEIFLGLSGETIVRGVMGAVLVLATIGYLCGGAISAALGVSTNLSMVAVAIFC